jgi:RNA polymerase sigma factor (sigma-70 family)
MASPQNHVLLRLVRGLAGEGPGTPDSELLERFISARDEGAFAELVRRHGPMVLSVCRGVLRHEQDAEDAFQAAFLVLARKAAAVRRQSVGGWLHTVTYHLACRARARSARRQAIERQVEPAPAADPLLDLSARDLLRALHEEVNRLPEKYRAPLVLCYLQERTQDEAARLLGCTEGALRGRLLRGREWLRERLAQRGLTMPAGISAFLLAHGLASAVPPGLVEAAVLGASGNAPAHVVALAEAGRRALSARVSLAVMLVLGLGALGVGAALLPVPAVAPPQPGPVRAREQKEPDKEARPLVDAQGDELPARAVARLGTLRWRQAALTFAFSPDGRYLAATGETTRVFDAASGKLVRSLPGPSRFLYFAPDRKTLLTTAGSPSPQARFWDVATGEELRQAGIVAPGNFYPDWSADGKLMAFYTHRFDKGPTVSFWDMSTGKVLRTWESPLAGLVPIKIALAPDGKTVALREQSAVYLFDVASAKELRRLASPLGNAGHTGGTRLADFSADGKFLACTEESNVRVWETATGKSAHHFRMRGDQATTVALCPTGRFLAAGGGKGTVCLWDLTSGKLAHVLAASRAGMPVYLLAFSADGKRLASQAHMSKSIRLWDVRTGREVPAADAPSTDVAGLAFAPDGKVVATADADGAVWLWDVATGKLRRRFSSKSYMGLNLTQPLAVLPRAEALVRGGYRSQVTTWDLRSGRQLRTGLTEAVLPIAEGPPSAQVWPACSPDGKTVVVVFPGELKRRIEPPIGRGPPRPPKVTQWTMIGLWDARTGKKASSFRVDAEHLARVVMSPDGRLLAGVGRLYPNLGKTVVFVWELASGRELRRLEVPALDGWNGIAFSADGRTILSGAHPKQGRKYRFHFWEVVTGRQRAAVDCAVEGQFAPFTVFANDCLAALAVGADVSLIDPWTGKEPERLKGHKGKVEHLTFSRDGKRLASGSQDTTALVWDVTGALPAQEKVRLSAKELADCWTDLASEDAERAYRAVRRLARAPAQAVALGKKHLRAVPFPQRETIRRLLAALDSDDFAEREKATRELQGLGKDAEAALRQFLEGRPSLEAHRRAERILAQMKTAQTKAPPIPKGEALRALRALEVLERAGTREARRLLGQFAEGAPHATFTREARASWQRLGGHTAPR